MNGSILTLSAETAGDNFSRDPELSLPQFPRVPPEILVLPYGQTALLFEGANGTQVLSGRGARRFLPRLLPLLDGTRDLAALCRAFPAVSSKIVHDAIALLYSRGLLEDGASTSALDEVASFCGRYVDVTRVNRNRGDAVARLAVASVSICGEANAASVLATSLTQCGVGSVRVLQSPAHIAKGADLVVGLFSERHPAEPWHEAVQAVGGRLLHCHVGTEEVEVGPLFLAGKSGCLSCLRTIRTVPRGVPDAGTLNFWAGVLGLHAFHLLSRVGHPNLYNVCHVHTHSESGPLYEEQHLARLPGCRTCGLEGRTPLLHEPNGLVWLLHNITTGMPPRELLNARDYQMHYAPANIQITKEVPEPFYGALRVALPSGLPLEVELSWGRRVAAKSTLTVEDLATLLQYTVGFQRVDGANRRLAPTAGGLGSTTAFIAARGISGLEDGIYHYYAPEHRLERLREGHPELIAGALGIALDELPPLVLVGVGALTKLRQKYGNFAYRFANFDAGFARAQLYEILQAVGLSWREYPEARDRVLTDAFAIPTVGTRHVVTFAVGVGDPRGGPPTLRSVIPMQYVEALVELASVGTVDIGRRVEKHDLPLVDRLPDVAPGGLEDLLRRRRSVRTFAAKPVEGGQLRSILALGAALNEQMAGHGALEIPLKIRVGITRGDTEHPAGVYAFDSRDAKLTCLRPSLKGDELHDLMLQRSLTEAPVVVFLSGDFETVVGRQGARGYREMLGRVGAVAGRILIAATAHGVSGCPWGGLIEYGWGKFFGTDRYSDCPLFGVSLGYPS